MSLKHDQNAVMLAHAGEIGIKSKTTRRFMIKALYQNISNKFPEFNLKFKNISNRSIIYTDKPVELAKGIADCIFGISHTAPIYLFSLSNYDELLTICTEYASQFMKVGCSFGYAARSSGPNHPPSQQLKADLGSKLWEYFEGNITVNLTNPDFLFTVEVRDNIAWIYHELYQGQDGFPPGVQQGVIYGNLRFWLPDYVAVYLVLKRGVKVKPIRFLTTNESSPIEEAWHNQFLEKFVFKKTIEIPIFELLQIWKEKFGTNLCSACMFFSESFLSKLSKQKHELGYTSGLKLSNISGDITENSLKWLEDSNNGFKIRPNLLTNDDPTQYHQIFNDFPTSKACCPFQTKRFINLVLSSSEINLIEQSVQNYLTKYFEPYSDIKTN